MKSSLACWLRFPACTFLLTFLGLDRMPISAQSTVNPLSLPIEWSATVEGALDLPGQQDRFNLQVTSGQRLFFDSLDADADSIYVRLTSPSGQVLWEFESRYDSWPFYALEDGTYTLTLFASGDTVGDYRFRILNLANAGNMVFGLEIAGRLPSWSDHGKLLHLSHMSRSRASQLPYGSIFGPDS